MILTMLMLTLSQCSDFINIILTSLSPQDTLYFVISDGLCVSGWYCFVSEDSICATGLQYMFPITRVLRHLDE